MPIACRSAATSPSFSTCFLDWMNATDANSPWVTLLPKATNGFSKRMVIVWGSSTSMLLISRNSAASELAEPSFASVVNVYFTSSAVSGSPL